MSFKEYISENYSDVQFAVNKTDKLVKKDPKYKKLKKEFLSSMEKKFDMEVKDYVSNSMIGMNPSLKNWLEKILDRNWNKTINTIVNGIDKLVKKITEKH